METKKIEATFYCGVDMHAKTSYLCILDQVGDIQLRRNIPNNFQMFKYFVEPYLPDLAIGVESTYNYYWLLDGCNESGMNFYLGHALYMPARPPVLGHGRRESDQRQQKEERSIRFVHHRQFDADQLFS